ncbi:TPA_asm: Cof-type HAD-IIB family hydrolase [Listeria monocytogenes]|uniref:Cof-type HAD-IIB family hydrolase n=1 Tax=Listeria monocytogenes TaxID=1639 RepID=UPI000A1D3DE9|nr:Cof-type HAD-IIB family hydrolase [Listeria monocytogenes]ARM71676.1 HAD superfamily hydrolase [Listeria monocytogenes]HAB0010204.1 Cof-type HAD-IIB family hydrolase [Listeria monocytogenes]
MEKYLICSDLDGTLLLKNQTISPKTLDLLQQLMEEGHHFAVATGRMYNSATDFAKMVHPKADVIASNGGVVAVSGEIIQQSTMKKSALLESFSLCQAHDLAVFFFSTNTVYYTKTPPSYFSDEEDKGRVNATKLVAVQTEQAFLEHYDQFVNGIVIEEEDFDKLGALRSELEKLADVSILSSHANNIEILPKDMDKKYAVKKLADYLKVKPENVITFGDGENDIGMLEVAGVGIAMDNASDLVKKSADYVTTANDADGIYYFLKQHLNR